MTNYIKAPHLTLFIGSIGCRKSDLVYDLIEKE